MDFRFIAPALRRRRLLGAFVLGAAVSLLPACHRKVPAAPAVAQPPPAASQGVSPSGPIPIGGPSAPGRPAASGSIATLPPLDQLLAPIALYPDPLIALILPSATVPTDLGAAAQFLASHGDPSQIASQPWSDSVKGLAHYPDVLAWMNDNMAWTQQVGGAFAGDPTAVMNAIQDLRARAQTAGTLQSGPQDQVVTDGGAIEIEPAQPDVIYVPRYDLDVVYFGPPPGYYADSYFYWGDPYPMGVWLTYDFDWRGHAVWRGDWYNYRREHGGWGRPVAFAQVRFTNSHGPERWGAPANAPHWSGAVPHDFVRSMPMRGTPPPFRDRRVDEAPRFRDEGRPEPGPRVRSERMEPGREERDRRDGR
jgi:Protein of unknown function (DUF3300)